MSSKDTPVPLAGLELDNLLGFLTLLGLLRALEVARPAWSPGASWQGTPLVAHLHTVVEVTQDEIAMAACEGIEAFVEALIVEGHKNVDFSFAEFGDYAGEARVDSRRSLVAAALCAQLPRRIKAKTEVQVSPLVMMFGQGHQNFLERLVAVPRGDVPNRMSKAKNPPNLRDSAKVAEALFSPWLRTDRTDGFRWDPEDDQRYALRYDDPSKAGAAPTVHGANRLAVLGFLSYPCFPLEQSSRKPRTAGYRRQGRGVSFVWPVWSVPLCLTGIEALLAHPAIANGKLDNVKPYGVTQILAAQRVSNGKFLNVARARPWSGPEDA